MFEPSEIAARFLTADDDVIRATDVPERLQLTTSSLSPHATLGPSLLAIPFPSTEMSAAAEWVATRLPARVREEYFMPTGRYHHLLSDLILSVTAVLKYILQQYLEVPYIWTHRRDHISHFEPGKPRITLLDRDDLWRIHALAARYRALWMRRQVLEDTYEKMHVEDRYYEFDIKSGISSVEGVSDALDWLSIKYKKAYQDAVEFGGRYDENGEVSGQKQQKKPSRITQYDLAKASVVSRLASVSAFQFYTALAYTDLALSVTERSELWY